MAIGSSFYGNVFYEFGQLFHRFCFKNKGKNSEDVPKDNIADQFEKTAQERWDILEFSTGNKWIGLKENKDGVEIFHNKPGQEKTNTSGFSPVNQSDEAFTPLTSGGKFSTYDLKFDTTGHLASAIKKNYILPSGQINIGTGQDINLSNDNKFVFEGKQKKQVLDLGEKELYSRSDRAVFANNISFGEKMEYKKVISNDKTIGYDLYIFE